MSLSVSRVKLADKQPVARFTSTSLRTGFAPLRGAQNDIHLSYGAEVDFKFLKCHFSFLNLMFYFLCVLRASVAESKRIGTRLPCLDSARHDRLILNF